MGIWNVNRQKGGGKFKVAGQIGWNGNYATLPIQQRYWPQVFLSDTEIRKPAPPEKKEEWKVTIINRSDKKERETEFMDNKSTKTKSEKKAPKTAERAGNVAEKIEKAPKAKAEPKTAKREGNVPAKKAKKAPKAKTAKREGNVATKKAVDHRDPKPGSKFSVTFKGKEYTLRVVKEGDEIAYKVGNESFGSPSGAGRSVTGNQVNGWRFWKIN